LQILDYFFEYGTVIFVLVAPSPRHYIWLYRPNAGQEHVQGAEEVKN
jgi:hypothetical protein